MTPRTPVSGNYTRGINVRIGEVIAADYIDQFGLRVLSAVEIVEGHSGLLVPHYHVSVSARSGIASAAMMNKVRQDFQMQDAEEDNHGKGVVRHLWREVYGEPKECHCKNEEAPMVDGEREWRK